MAHMTRGEVKIHYEVDGIGEPVLVLAPGGMRSALGRWYAAPWNPRLRLAGRFRVIAMDQRNAGSSTAPVSASDGWPDYTADQIALLDHLEVDRCHLLGMCIGGPFIFGLLTAAPDRFWSAVVLQPVGMDGNRAALRSLFDDWSAEISGDHPEATEADWHAFADNMWGGDFVLTASRAEVSQITTPLLVFMGDDTYHPQSTSRDIGDLAPNATLVEQWKGDDVLPRTDATIQEFLAANSPDASNRL